MKATDAYLPFRDGPGHILAPLFCLTDDEEVDCVLLDLEGSGWVVAKKVALELEGVVTS